MNLGVADIGFSSWNYTSCPDLSDTLLLSSILLVATQRIG